MIKIVFLELATTSFVDINSSITFHAFAHSSAHLLFIKAILRTDLHDSLQRMLHFTQHKISALVVHIFITIDTSQVFQEVVLSYKFPIAGFFKLGQQVKWDLLRCLLAT